MTEAVLDITDLRTYFHTDEGVVRAVDGVSFRVDQGHTLDSSGGTRACIGAEFRGACFAD